MEHSVLDLALRASLNPQIDTKALRLTLGLHAPIAEALAKPGKYGPRTEAFLAKETRQHRTGMSLSTIKAVAPLAAEQIGLVVPFADGARGLMEGTGHGQAAGWQIQQPHAFPALAPVDLTGADQFLDPANVLWANNRHRAWRVAMVVVATHGMARAEITTGEVADLMGISRSNASRALSALEEMIAVKKTGHGVWTTVFEAALVVSDSRMPQEQALKAHEDRQQWVAENQAAQEAYAEEQASLSNDQEVTHQIRSLEPVDQPATVLVEDVVRPNDPRLLAMIQRLHGLAA